jgi:catechol-2,3-dioxygenase
MAGGKVRIGHVGLYARDLEGLRDFYRDTLGLQVSDEDLDFGIVFMSSDPEQEHHMLALARGRTTDDSVQMVQQVSWIVDSVEELREYHEKLRDAGVRVQSEVTHGNSISIYFFDPEGNRNEVYYKTGLPAEQPFRKQINLDLPAEEILRENERLVAEGNGRPAVAMPAAR